MIDLKPACHQMIDLITTVTDDQLANPTPCADYTLRDLLEHVDEAARGFAAVAGGREAAPADGRRSLAENVELLGEAWANPAAWQGSSDAAGITLANERWGKIALTEMVVHGWDIARSIDVPFSLPEDTVKSCFEHVAEFVPNAPIPQLWGPAVEIPDTAPLLDRVVAITGRDPILRGRRPVSG